MNTSFTSQLPFTTTFTVFRTPLGLNISHSVANEVSSFGKTFGALCSVVCFFLCSLVWFSPWAKSLSSDSGAGGGNNVRLLSEWHACIRSCVLIGVVEQSQNFSCLSWHGNLSHELGKGWSGPQYWSILKVEPPSQECLLWRRRDPLPFSHTPLELILSKKRPRAGWEMLTSASPRRTVLWLGAMVRRSSVFLAVTVWSKVSISLSWERGWA